MSVPKSVIKFKKGKMEYTSNVDAVQYTLEELVRGALRDVGKYLAREYRTAFYARFKRVNGQVGKGVSYWARRKEKDLQIGIGRKGIGFWGGILDTKKANQLLKTIVYNNISKIEEIEGKYLSELSKDNPNLNGLSEGDYIGDEE